MRPALWVGVGLFVLTAVSGCGVRLSKPPVSQTARPQPAAPVSERPKTMGERIADTARSLIGTPYRYGGEGPSGFDCSGLTYYVFGRYGYQLPRQAESQMDVGRHVGRKKLQPGDLVFFKVTWYGSYHVGIFLGDGRFIHAPRSGKKVEIQRLDDDYYDRKYYTARRIIG